MRASIAIIIIAAALAVGLTNAGAVEEPKRERYARYYLPWGSDTPRGEWQPESTIPRDPQEAVKMLIWEVSRFHDVDELTPEQEKARDELIERCYVSAETRGWYEVPS